VVLENANRSKTALKNQSVGNVGRGGFLEKSHSAAERFGVCRKKPPFG
jgi:hypothetical protein